MISDERQKILAKNLVNYSCEVQPGENVLIEASGVPYQFVNLLVKEVFAAGGFPFVSLGDNKIKREIMKCGGEELFKRMAKYDELKMRDMQAYIGIRGGENSYELSDAPAGAMQAYSKYYAHPVHHELRVKKTKWVSLRYPTEGMSELAGMSTEAYEDFYFDVCCLDYKKMGEAMTPLVDLMNKTDKVRIVAKDTDLTFSIKGIGAVKCKGERNIPDGEVYTAPVKDSINGVIGQAWIIEALVYAFEVFRDEAYLDCAVSVFHSQHFDPLTGFWKRVDPDGRELGYDYTLNHQVWFCLAGLLILQHRRDEEIRRQVSHFLRRVRREYFGVHPDGLIRHYGRMTRFRRPFAALYAKQYVKYAGLRLGVFDPKKVDLLTQEEGYQLFELFGYALIARLRPDDPLFRTKAFRRALALGTDTDRMNERLGVGDPETMNPYAYGYNSPAFEEPLVELLFTGRADAGKTLSLLELQKRLCYDPETRRLDRNTRDPETLAARLYEYVHFCDCCRGDR